MQDGQMNGQSFGQTGMQSNFQPNMQPQAKSFNGTLVACILMGVASAALIAFGVFNFVSSNNNSNPSRLSEDNIAVLRSMDDYYKKLPEGMTAEYGLSASDFEDNVFIMVTHSGSDCSWRVSDKGYKIESDHIDIYYKTRQTCGNCLASSYGDLFRVSRKNFKEDIRIKEISTGKEDCDDEIPVAYKPMIYIYPEEEMDLSVYVGHPENLTTTYPAYADGWNVHVTPDGNIHDYATDRDYYGLYWEGDNSFIDNPQEGFVVNGADSAKFFEEKLALLGLNDYEINEFIVYWLPKLESHPYNLIRFRTAAEIEQYMPLEFSTEPDTLIRVLVDFWPLEEPIKIKTQQLETVERKGFTVVEWGGTPHGEF